jgi:hypothetical protein
MDWKKGPTFGSDDEAQVAACTVKAIAIKDQRYLPAL